VLTASKRQTHPLSLQKKKKTAHVWFFSTSTTQHRAVSLQTVISFCTNINQHKRIHITHNDLQIHQNDTILIVLFFQQTDKSSFAANFSENAFVRSKFSALQQKSVHSL